MRTRILLGAALVVAALVLATTALAQTSPNYDLSWHVVAGGGQKVGSANHAMQSTVGQLAVGPAASTHTLGSGYWYGISRAATYGVYLPIVLRGSGP